MDLSKLAFSLGLMGPFASRVFLPAFVTALLLRFGNQIPVIEHLGILGHLAHNQPTWFTANPTLVILGVLAAAEVFSQKSSEARMILQEFDLYLKPAMAFMTAMGFLNTTDAGFIAREAHQAGMISIASIVALITAVGCYQVAGLRKKILGAVLTHFEGTRMATWFSWLEDSSVVFGIFFMFLFAIFMLFAVVASIVGLLIIRKRVQIAEEHRKIPCVKCGALTYPCAICCCTCGTPVAQPVEIGFFGQSKMTPVEDLADQPYRLVEKRRCPRCAARLPLGRPFDPCPACGKVQMADPAFVEAYSDYIGRRLPLVLGGCFAISFIPILGMFVGSVYYELALVLPFNQYLSLGRRFLLRWEVRILFLLIAILQIVPLLGSVAVPLMAWISYGIHRRSYRMYLLTPQHPSGRRDSSAGVVARVRNGRERMIISA